MDNLTIIASSRNWIDSRSIEALKKITKYKGVKSVVGLPDLSTGLVPNGAAVLCKDRIYPHLIGSDIGCGMSLFEVPAKAKKIKPQRFAKYLSKIESLDEIETAEPSLGYNLGTIGKGNHFAELHLVNEVHDRVLIKSQDRRLLGLKGTHLWRCQSPFRPKHKRKNWYFSLTIQSEFETAQFNENQVVYQTLKSPKKGGQHVNKTSSGVRALYPPLGLEAISFDERSQHLNKKIAIKRLLAKAEELNRKQKAKQKTQRWQESRALKRGDAVLVFEEFNFKMKYKSSISS